MAWRYPPVWLVFFILVILEHEIPGVKSKTTVTFLSALLSANGSDTSGALASILFASLIVSSHSLSNVAYIFFSLVLHRTGVVPFRALLSIVRTDEPHVSTSWMITWQNSLAVDHHGFACIDCAASLSSDFVVDATSTSLSESPKIKHRPIQ